jgi:hypothetical protein
METFHSSSSSKGWSKVAVHPDLIQTFWWIRIQIQAFWWIRIQTKSRFLVIKNFKIFMLNSNFWSINAIFLFLDLYEGLSRKHYACVCLRWWKLEGWIMLGRDVLPVYVWVNVGTQLSEFAIRTNPPLSHLWGVNTENDPVFRRCFAKIQKLALMTTHLTVHNFRLILK